MARPSRDSDDHVTMAVSSSVGDVLIVSSIGTFEINTLALRLSYALCITHYFFKIVTKVFYF